eukprot:scaffold40910_cov72-Phaeocystis_antarctica.AAC.11
MVRARVGVRARARVRVRVRALAPPMQGQRRPPTPRPSQQQRASCHQMLSPARGGAAHPRSEAVRERMPPRRRAECAIAAAACVSTTPGAVRVPRRSGLGGGGRQCGARGVGEQAPCLSRPGVCRAADPLVLQLVRGSRGIVAPAHGQPQPQQGSAEASLLASRGLTGTRLLLDEIEAVPHAGQQLRGPPRARGLAELRCPGMCLYQA